MAIIIGIDPGTRVTGYGIISSHPSLRLIDYGCIRPPPTASLPERYRILFESIEQLIAKYTPDILAVESQFVMKNAQSALKLGMAKGMAFLAAAKKSMPVYEFPPKKAKQAVVGKGQASKYQVQKMIQMLLQLQQTPEPEDAADALALAICCAHHLKVSQCTSPFKVS